MRVIPLVSATLALIVITSTANSAEPVRYNRDVRPILSANCFTCHGPDSASRKADLRLDRREQALESGALVPHKPEESELLTRILSDDPALKMPPPSTHHEITPAERETLKRWIAEGAAYEAHWSLLPPVRPVPPRVQRETWIRNPIDRFVLARLEAMGLEPAPEADRRTLARRLSLDLTGLPPEPELVEQFVNDPMSDALEKLVDTLMARSEWGEHRARYWLDAARYADTHGIHFDNYREAWAYRDWVIGAFNRNLPFDQFTIEQLAGDLLENPTLEQRVASGFNRCNMTTNEGGVIPEEYLVLYTRDRTETTAAVFLGTTAGCAVCHDHKFDSLTQKEFYELAAFFNNTTQNAMDGNIKDTPPTLPVPSAADRPRWDALGGELAAARQKIETLKQSSRGEFEPWLASPDAQALASRLSTAGLRLLVPSAGSDDKAVQLTVDGQPRRVELEALKWEPGHAADRALVVTPGQITLSEVGDFEADQAFTCGAWVKLNDPNQTGSIVARMDDQHDYRGWDLWVEHGKVGAHLVYKWPGDALKAVSKQPLKANTWTHVTVSYDGSRKGSEIKVYFDGVAQPTDVKVGRLTGSMKTDVPLKIGQRHSSSPLAGLALSDLRIHDRALDAAEVRQTATLTRVAALAAKPSEQRSQAETDELYGWWLETVHAPSVEARAHLANLEKEKSDIASRGTIAHVMQEKSEAAQAYILFRGEYDQRRDPTRPNTPSMFPAFPAELPKNRLGFARWLMQPNNPLVARVAVNRFWQEVFGTGLVRTTSDFGVAGELPSDQELLDWLAVEFRESGWDVKRLLRLYVTSAAYRQAALHTPAKLAKDPQNRYLSRGPRFRLDAEVIRDSALASSGLLVRKLGGPSVKPYQPTGVWEAVAMIGSNTRDYKPDQGESLYRRGLYTFWKRAAPPASLEIFNAPSREVCTLRRERTNTPLQALVTLNDEQYVEAARHLAQLVLARGGTTDQGRLDLLARRVLSRPWLAEEQSVLTTSLAELTRHYQAHPDQAQELLKVGAAPADPGMDPATLAAWTMLCNEAMNLDENLNK